MAFNSSLSLISATAVLVWLQIRKINDFKTTIIKTAQQTKTSCCQQKKLTKIRNLLANVILNFSCKYCVQKTDDEKEGNLKVDI